MLKNFFKTAARSIARNKAYAFINFIGLTCGLTLALLIFSYVRSELSYDRFHEKADRIYRIKYEAPNGLLLASSPPPIAPVMKDYFPDVEETARVYGRNISIKRLEADDTFEENSVFFVDSAFFKIFDVEFVSGNPERPLHDKFTVIINEEMAVKYFGSENPIGESLLFGGKHAFKVIGVVKDFPENSHLRFNMLVPYENMYDMESDQSAQILRANLAVNFIISHSYTYVLLKPGASSASIDTNMNSFLQQYAKPQFLVGQIFTLMPLVDIHLKSTLLAEPSNTNSMSNIYIFIGVGILTLIIASINYINLSTAQSFTRIKEIGIRKILGSLKSQLVGQFLAESFLFIIIATVLSFGLFYLALPYLNELTNKTLTFTETVDIGLLLVSGILIALITVLAGGYPAYFVTKFESVNALKGQQGGRGGSQLLRKSLVVFQLAIACILLSGALLIVKQLRFLQERPLGFQKEHVINIPLFSQNLNGIFRQNDSTFRSRLQTYRDIVESRAGVKATSLSSNAPGLGVVFRGTIPEGFTQEDNMFLANISVDYDFIKTYGMEVVAGRSFDKNYGTDEAEGFIINETAVREFNWENAQQAIGKTLNREGKVGKVIGVVKDFYFASLATPISPLIMEVNTNQFNTLSIKFENENVTSTLEGLEKAWNDLFPEKAFQFTFLDEQLNSQYQNFNNFSSIIKVFTAIAILISCLGVYGLVLFVVQRKVKEIGIRKVLGSTVGGILMLIYRDFAFLLLIGFVLGIPVSYYLVNDWLGNFSARTSIDVFTYFISLVVVFLIVSMTVSFQAIKASLANPVRSLRSE